MPISVRDAGAWKEAEPHVRDAGVWKPLDTGHVRDAGAWKQFYKSGFDPSTPIGTFVEEEGGYYIGLITYADSRKFALFTAPKSSGQTNSVQWKTSFDDTPNASSNYDGMANVQAMIAQSISLHPIAQFTNGLSIGGKTDWYPPSLNELGKLYDARDAISGVDIIDKNATPYWSSTSPGPLEAWSQRFDTGEQIAGAGSYKTHNKRCRAIRRVAI